MAASAVQPSVLIAVPFLLLAALGAGRAGGDGGEPGRAARMLEDAAGGRADEHLPDIGLMHDPDHRPALVGEADEHRPAGHAADEGPGAVHRIEHPGKGRPGRPLAVFLPDDAVVGKGRLDQRPHGAFACPVGRGDRIEARRELVVHIGPGAEVRQDLPRRRLRQPLGEAGILLPVDVGRGHGH